jgi:hypothetical protein
VLARVALLLLVFAPAAWAHTASKSQLTLRVDGNDVHGLLVASLVDVAIALHIPSEQAPELTQRAVEAKQAAQWQAYLAQGLVVFLDGEPQRPAFEAPAFSERDGEAVLQVPFTVSTSSPVRAIDVLYTLFFEDDVLHECLARVEWPGGVATNRVIRLNEPLVHIARRNDRGLEFRQFLKSGALHVWTGYDHVLFLLALLLPSVLLGRPGAWVPAPVLSGALLRAATIVTAFTLAHTSTLGIAALWSIDFPSRLVEPAIAASVFIAAACNLVPGTAALGGAWMAFGFGLIHGTAFGQTLNELISDRSDVWRPLLAFNLGVEAGQLAIVAAFFPVAWMLRSTKFYRQVVVRGGSAVVCACAIVWFVARVR